MTAGGNNEVRDELGRIDVDVSGEARPHGGVLADDLFRGLGGGEFGGHGWPRGVSFHLRLNLYQAAAAVNGVIEFFSSPRYNGHMITTAQMRAARALIGWKQAELAAAAGISLTALNNIERGSSDPKASTLDAIQRALEAAGVRFLEDGGVSPVQK